MEQKNIIDEFLETRYNILKIRNIRKIHISIDYYFQLKAHAEFRRIAPVYSVQYIGKDDSLPLCGYPCEIHNDMVEKIWFEDEDGRNIENTRNNHFTTS